MKTYIKINVNGRTEKIEGITDETEYQTLSAAVGGMIEIVPSVFENHFLYLNEEGKLFGMEVNQKATVLAHGLSIFDMIVGDAVLVGPLDEEGNHESVEDSVIKELVG